MTHTVTVCRTNALTPVPQQQQQQFIIFSERRHKKANFYHALSLRGKFVFLSLSFAPFNCHSFPHTYLQRGDKIKRHLAGDSSFLLRRSIARWQQAGYLSISSPIRKSGSANGLKTARMCVYRAVNGG
jgi:hypothetical protein